MPFAARRGGGRFAPKRSYALRRRCRRSKAPPHGQRLRLRFRLRPRFQDHVERGGGRLAKPGETAGSDDISSPSLGYRIISATSGGTSGLREPEWPRTPGAIVQDGGLTWQCYDNRLGLEMIRVTIRFRDPASGSPRQVTLVHSFVE